MSFDLSNATQSSSLEHAIKAKLYKSVYEKASKSSRKKQWIRWSGLGIGIVSGLLTLAKRVARIGESILKGMINLVGSLFSDACDAKLGLKQLFLDSTWQLVVKLPLSIIMLVFSIPYKTVSFAISPKSYAKGLWIDHDLDEKQKQIEAPKIAAFKKAEEDIKINPKDIEALKTLGDCYRRGFGTVADENKSIEFYKRAADLNDANSKKILGDIFEKEALSVSLDWYKKASEGGDLDAYFKLGLHHYSKGRQSEIDKATTFFKQAAESGHVLSKACLIEILPPDEISRLGLTCSPPEKAEAKSYLGIK